MGNLIVDPDVNNRLLTTSDLNNNESIFKVSGIKNTYMKPRIVAIIPAHNEEKSIHNCLAGFARSIFTERMLILMLLLLQIIVPIEQRKRQ